MTPPLGGAGCRPAADRAGARAGAVRIVVLGPPGSGKGTQASAMQRRWGLAHVASGDLLRANVRDNTELGRRAKPYMEAGELVPDALILEMMEERLSRPDAQAGFVLDGFPRTTAQAEALDQRLERMRQRLDAVVYLRVSEEEILRRLSGRLICPQCNAIYQVDTLRPRRPGLCDWCGARLVEREDDEALEVTRRRFRVYEEQTAPVVDYYRRKRLLNEIDGTIGVDRVLAEISKILEAAGTHPA